MYVQVLHHPNYKSMSVSNPGVVGENTDEHGPPFCQETRRIPSALLKSGDEKEEEVTTGEEHIGARSRTKQSEQRRKEEGLGRRRKSSRAIKFYSIKYRRCGRRHLN